MKIVLHQFSNNLFNNNLFNNNLFNNFNNLLNNKPNIILLNNQFNLKILSHRRMKFIFLLNRLICRRTSPRFSPYITQIIESRTSYFHFIKLFKITISNKIMIIARNLLHWSKCISMRRNTVKVLLRISITSL